MKKVSLTAGLSLVAAALCGLIGTILTWHHYTEQHRFMRQEKESAIQKTKQAADQLDLFISELKPLVHTLADTLTNQALTPNEIEALLKKKPTYVSGFGVAFLPEASPTHGLYAPYYLEQENKQVFMDVADVYDYTTPEHAWFSQPLTGAQFNDPYFGQASKTILAEYAAPFYRTQPDGSKKVAGIVFANQSVIHLEHLLDTLFLGATGYWFILSAQQTFLAHPNRNRVREQQTLKQLAEEKNDAALQTAYELIGQRKPVFVDYYNEITHTDSWLVCEHIPSSNWTICGVFDKEELFTAHAQTRRSLIHIASAYALMLIFLALFCASWITKFLLYWWTGSLAISFVLALEVAAIWYSTHRFPSFNQNITGLSDKQTLFDFIEDKFFKKVSDSRQSDVLAENAHKRTLDFQLADPGLVPTGIFITHLQFLTEKQVEFVGFIWQRYIQGMHDALTQSFTLPQATESTVTQLTRKTVGDTDTILWHVHAKLDQYFGYRRYPFDVKNIQIQLWHPDVNQKVLLVPDFDSYILLNPHARLGLSPNLHIPGWTIDSSYFGYMQHDYKTSFGMYGRGPFGIYQEIDRGQIPELYFSLDVKRRLIDTLIGDLLPLAVVALLLFAILATNVGQGYGVLGSCAAVFFGLVFAQVRFRSKIPSYQLVYFENLYFIMYAAIVWILIVSLLHLLNTDIWVIQYRNNLIAKLLYWPLILITLVVTSLYYLY